MGANAQTSVLDFTNGQVLTGPQMDISAGTGVPVFATTVTRDAAFGGANKVLAEGQTCYLESTNVVQYYDGAAWATVGPTAASGIAKVWCEFNGSGTIAILASFNTASLTDNGVGYYTVNFTTAFSTANYAFTGGAVKGGGGVGASNNPFVGYQEDTMAVGSIKVFVMNPNGSLVDSTKISVVCFGDQ